MGCVRLRGPLKNAGLVAMSCLTLINEGADTDRICESQGEPEARGHPEAEGRGWQGEGHGHPSTPSGKGQRGKHGPGATSSRVGHQTGPPRMGRREGVQDERAAATVLEAPAHTGLLPPPQTRSSPWRGLAPNGAPKGTLSPCPHSEAWFPARPKRVWSFCPVPPSPIPFYSTVYVLTTYG